MDSENRVAGNSTGGFTLVEVLVAVAVVAIGLTGVMTTINGMANSASYLRDKTLANWVAQNHIVELRLQEKWPAIGKNTDDVEMAGQDWRIVTEVSATPVEKLRRLDVSVAYKESPDNSLINIAAFVGEPVVSGLPRDWRAGAPETAAPQTPAPDSGGKPSDDEQPREGGT